MKLKDKLNIGWKIIKSRFLNKKMPLAVGWSITNKCNLKCLYCYRWKSKDRDLKTPEIFSIIDELKSLGTKIISFTGGEALLRDDIGAIVDYVHKKGVYCNINTNGTLFSEKINELNGLDSVKFSLDGPQKVNDYIRGEGTFQEVIGAIKIAKIKKIACSIVTVLSKYNLGSIEYLITLSKNLDAGIVFQPPTLTLLGSKDANLHIPNAEEYRKTIDKIIEYKKKNKIILNTTMGLNYLRNWPSGKNILCSKRRISCKIATSGYMYNCSRHMNNEKALNCSIEGVKKAFDNLTYVSCNDCWCALHLELNFMASFSNLETIFSAIRRI